MRVDCLVIGVEIRSNLIKSVLINNNADILIQSESKSPCPLMPGAITITLCELIESLDPNHNSLLVGIGLPSKIEIDGYVLNGSNEWSHWHEVPFVDWLEIRLERHVVLESYQTCRSFQKVSRNPYPLPFINENPIPIGAACLALEHFKI